MVRGYRIRIQAEGTRITATCIGVPAANADLTKSWWGTAGLPLPFIEGRIEGGRLVGIQNEIWYRYDGAGISKSKPINIKIEFNGDGTWFKLGDIDWNAWKGNDWHLFYGKDKQ